MRSNVWMKPVVDSIMPPALYDFWAARFNPSWSWDQVLARVVSRQTAARDAVTLVLKANRHYRGFVPGQHLNVTVEINGVRYTRSYSPSPVAGQPRQLAITVKRIEGGRVSAWLCDHARAGDVLTLGEAYGEMTLDATTDSDLVLLAAGSGITPFLAMLRAQATLGMPRRITLCYWARQRDELCCAAELQALAARFPNFRMQPVLTRDAADPDHGERLQSSHLAMLPALANATVYACGPAGFVASARELVAATGARFEGEAFTAPELVNENGELVRVLLSRSRRELFVPSGQPLLAALEAQGLKPASGCRMGICNTCACGKQEGTTEDVRTGERRPEPSSALRICISSARTDLTLDL